MFERVVIATDLSKDSNALIDRLEILKSYGTKKCILLNCLSIQEGLSIAVSYSTALLEQVIWNQKKTLEKYGYDVETRVLTGGVRDEINRIAVSENCSAIITGARKYTLSGGLFPGRLAYGLIHYARRPVLLVRLDEGGQGKETPAEKCPDFSIDNHILLPTDFSENADSAFSYVSKMVENGAKKITLLHVQDAFRISPYLEDRIDEFNAVDNMRLQNMKKKLLGKGNVEVSTLLRYGSPSIEILKAIDELKVGLVVMGSQGRGFVKGLFLGSVSHNITRLSLSSVLLIPAEM